MKLKATVVLGLLALGCGKDEPFNVFFSENYGLCDEGCYGSIRVTSDGEATATRTRFADDERLTEPFTLTQEQLDAVRADVETALAEPWAPLYGEPDSVDQGSYRLELEVDGDSRVSAVDPLRQPAHLEPLLTRLNALLDAKLPSRSSEVP